MRPKKAVFVVYRMSNYVVAQRRSLPPLTNLKDFRGQPIAVPPEIIEGVLHQGCKLVLAGTSKTNKSWSLLDMALSVATGGVWWGRRCAKKSVVYLNFELQPWAIQSRLSVLAQARRLGQEGGANLHLWNLRGFATDISMLRPTLERSLDQVQPGLVIVDPVYKLLGARDENQNGAIGEMLTEFELLAQSTGAAITLAHHFAKGDSASKDPIDRMSGAGAWARDPDTLLIMSPTLDEGCYEVTPILRNLPRIPSFVVRWDFPLMVPTGRVPMTEGARKFFKSYITAAPQGRSAVVRAAQAAGITAETANKHLVALESAGLVVLTETSVWRADSREAF